MSRPRGIRSVRVASCSSYHGDPAYEMYRQATLGDVDFITGDYLAEVNLANDAEVWRNGKHPGYEETAWEGIQQTIDVIAHKRIRVIINGEPRRSCRVLGDDLYSHVGPNMPTTREGMCHLDSGNPDIIPSDLTYAFLNTDNGKPTPMVSAHAYLGARGIVDGLRRGADVIICGRVADASPLIAAAWYWHTWSETDYDRVAGSLIAGHLIECSAYVTGGNFSGFDKHPLEDLVAPGFPISEIASDGTCVITKHSNTQGIVNEETVACQFLYKLQGTTYLNSDVSADISDVAIKEIGRDRVYASGIRGSPPPSTTKLAVFYQGGYEAQLLLNATGYATGKKWDMLEKQTRHFIPEKVLKSLETLEFQRIGTPASDPSLQEESTIYLRIFVASRSQTAMLGVAKAMKDISLKHLSGFHSSMDTRTAMPIRFLAYYPAPIKQADIHETINFIDGPNAIHSYETSHPPQYKEPGMRESYDPSHPKTLQGPTKKLPLGDIAIGRSGDKGENLNCGIFSSTSRLDGFGKGFVDYIRDKLVDVPVGPLL
ncbi:DUF1446-domain-containing protein [Aspergillus heteromorphus CBS 117.55]|uniref:DUF1446-domain-containing protein n=1 Tax=Aspergillus heteromorphus CBS 117.55 TaxID=1448321 RepID=A0A317X2P6_9EURO|nr:DUF1446-domain-containing protein [Aspergillus heteromorphus CBS 117.55]PWY92836.1 DUF1446-domain-containing protein [Aspergillus heteromorphus CBS 117.55]